MKEKEKEKKKSLYIWYHSKVTSLITFLFTYYSPLTLFQGNVGLGTLEKGKPQFI